ncbi:MAG TPA: acyltransferase [Bacteroidetes bacterium]|nr:acyltransferase [Bacteroidota bacterium]
MEQKPEKIFFPNLDGLRFLAFFAVLLRHCGDTEFGYIQSNSVYVFVKKWIFMNGFLGVNFFFVLSGFLITYLLLNEKFQTGKISIRNFYIRRVLRIWPVYYLTLLIGFVIVPAIKWYFQNPVLDHYPSADANPWYYIFFLGNFHAVYLHSPHSPVLDRLWSIAAEEQFYLLWPLILSFLPVKKIPYAFGVLLITSAAFRYTHRHDGEIYLFHFLASMSDLVIGSTGAYLVFFNQRFKKYFEELSKTQTAIIWIITITVFLGYKFLLEFAPVPSVTRMLAGVVFLLVILEQNYSHNSLFKISKLKTISKWGVWSYGQYCYHALGIYAALFLAAKFQLHTTVFGVLVLTPLLALIVTVAISWFSYRFFETPFLKLKNKF